MSDRDARDWGKRATGRTARRWTAGMLWSLTGGAVLAQQRGGEAAACGACGAGLGVMILVPIVIIALNIALLVWVARDAKSRGMDSAVMWMVLVMFTSILGLAIYMFSRPQGNLIQCPSCNNKRLQASARCPHCGNA